MKSKPNRFLVLTSLSAILTAFPAFAATYQWNGSVSNAWSTPANWNASGVPSGITAGPAPTGITDVHRLNVNNGANNAAEYTIAEGTTNYGSSSVRGLVIGSGGSGSGTLNITGGTFSTLNSTGAQADLIGNSDNNTGTLNISGGTFIGAAAGTSMNLGGISTSGRVSNLSVSGSGTATLTTLFLNGTTINVNLDGGTMELNGVTNTAISLAAKIRFNGGTLKARQNNASFIAANANLETLVQSGGAVIDTNGFNITIAEPLLEDPGSTGGGLTKNGTGLLTLTQPSTTTGSTDINAGGLALKADSTSWAPSSFSHSGDLLNIDLGVYNSSNPVVIDTGALTVDSAVTVNVTGSNFQVGQIPLINYTSKSITGSLTLNPATLPVGVVATLEDDNAGQIYLDVTQAATIFEWSGASGTPGSGDWDIGSLNWNTFTTEYSTATDQLVNFPNITGGGTVNVTADFSPLIVGISNASSNPYTFEGTGKITGAAQVNKSGTGIVTFANGLNDYSGATTISGGALIKEAADATTGNITVSADNVSFVLNGGVTDGTGQTLYLAGRGITGTNYFFNGSQVQRGALQSHNGANTWQGDIVLTSNSATLFNRIGVQPGASLTLTGNITENVDGAYLLFRAGALGEDITLGGTGTYSYTNETQMYSTGASIILGNDNKLPTGELLNLTSNGTTVFDLNGFDQEFAGIYGGATGTGATITNNGTGPSVLTTSPVLDTTSSYNAYITDGSDIISFVKSGDGTQALSYTNDYSGPTTVNAGTLLINGDHGSATGAVQVDGGILGGTGVIGSAVTVGALGSLNPGVTTGTLTVDSADLSAGGTLVIDINDLSVSTDLLSVNNTLDVSDAKLNFNVAGSAAEPSYVIATASTISGTILPVNITGLPPGYTLVQTGTEIRLDQAPASDYDTWMALYPSITDPNDKLATADPDGDGLTNQEEYAFGLAPDSGSSVNPITLQLDKTSGAFSYTRRLQSLTGLTYTVWYSTNLSVWNQDTGAVQGAPAVSGEVETVPVTLSGPLLAHPKLFVQVRAE